MILADVSPKYDYANKLRHIDGRVCQNGQSLRVEDFDTEAAAVAALGDSFDFYTSGYGMVTGWIWTGQAVEVSAPQPVQATPKPMRVHNVGRNLNGTFRRNKEASYAAAGHW